uniref:Uncharacterized protein n=1 Tax=Megaviridae environmental sample TaxID=1737588 RepID=A0A5J6VJZ4_9VIRU|nr:MAG: hypothetical protein [Megaviridae environmental sample]
MEIDDYTIIKPVAKLIMLFNKSIKHDNLHEKWINYFKAAYDERNDYLLAIRVTNHNSSKKNILYDKFKKNYVGMRENFTLLSTINIINNENNKLPPIMNNDQLRKITTFQMITFIFQYLNEFDERSININLWNYCLKSMHFSTKNFLIGIVVLLCQYIYTISLLYHSITEFHVNDDPLIIVISVISTLISLLYSYNTICSFLNSLKLYKFLLTLYSDYPTLAHFNNIGEVQYYKEKKITMTRCKIIYNLCADFMSNFILPFIIPFINVFIILSSETSVDAILNCMAIFFIVQIDEDIYSTTDYKTEKNSIVFTRWIISNIFCTTFPEFNNTFRLETYHTRKKSIKRNKISPSNTVVNDVLY